MPKITKHIHYHKDGSVWAKGSFAGWEDAWVLGMV